MALFNVVGDFDRQSMTPPAFSEKAGKGAVTLCIDCSYKKFLVISGKPGRLLSGSMAPYLYGRAFAPATGQRLLVDDVRAKR
jgi:hypothetical protein